jgi:hypothetical protein
MTIIGAHAILYSKDAGADSAFLRDVLELGHVDVGGGWLIFELPPAEVAVHPAERGNKHELYLMCDDIHAFVTSMGERGIACTKPAELRWGVLTELTLPSGAKLGVYEPRHARPGAAPKSPTKRPRAAKPAAPSKKAPKPKAAKKTRR